MKKKLESDVLDLETALEHANAANAETQVQMVHWICSILIRKIEFDCWTALEHANAANAETQVYVVQKIVCILSP
jgi:hypothetical protein